MEKNAEFKSSLAQLIYTLIPFVFLILIKIYNKKPEDIFMSADWGIAASLLFGQAQAKITSAGLAAKNKANDSAFQLYNSIRILYLCVSLIVFTLISISPNIYLAIFQFLIFIFSIVIFIHDSLASQKIRSADDK